MGKAALGDWCPSAGRARMGRGLPVPGTSVPGGCCASVGRARVGRGLLGCQVAAVSLAATYIQYIHLPDDFDILWRCR